MNNTWGQMESCWLQGNLDCWEELIEDAGCISIKMENTSTIA